VEVLVDAAGRTGRLTVRDDGPGIPAGIRAQLFQPGVTSKPGGWGMGLALALRVVEQQHGGRLAHRPGATGTTFVIELPLAP
jgi:signal transduction histidine kinase